MELKCIPEADKKNYLNNIFFFTSAMHQESFSLVHVLRRDLHLRVQVHLIFTEGGGGGGWCKINVNTCIYKSLKKIYILSNK